MSDLVRTSLVEIQFRIAGVRMALAIGFRGCVVVLRRHDRNWLIVVGRV